MEKSGDGIGCCIIELPGICMEFWLSRNLRGGKDSTLWAKSWSVVGGLATVGLFCVIMSPHHTMYKPRTKTHCLRCNLPLAHSFFLQCPATLASWTLS
jgi:hypothetical protein